MLDASTNAAGETALPRFPASSGGPFPGAIAGLRDSQPARSGAVRDDVGAAVEPQNGAGDFAPTAFWQALHSRDARFDGRFFVGASTTRIYCRPVCPVPFAKPHNIEWFASAAAAEADGFHPCRRCRPQAAPRTPAWLGTSAVVSRALRLIWEGALDEGSVDALAGRVGIGSRQLRRLFVQHLGASPVRIAIIRRVHFARNLIEKTDLPITDIALSSGFSSIRQFNHAVLAASGHSPTELRRLRGRSRGVPSHGGLLIRLPYREPFDWTSILAFLRRRAAPGVEAVEDDCYRRSIEIEGVPGAIEVKRDAAAPQLLVRIELSRYEALLHLVERVRRIFDLGADPLPIANHLRRDPRLKPLLDARPGLRVPGAWDGFELSVCALLGARLTVADSVCDRGIGELVRIFGRPVKTSMPGITHLFPRPMDLVDADLSLAGIHGAPAAAVRALAGAVSRGEWAFEQPRIQGSNLEDTTAALCAVAGIDRCAAEYIALRVFAEPDAFPASDPGLRHVLADGGPPAEVLRVAESWRPWRAYAAMHCAGHAEAGAAIPRAHVGAAVFENGGDAGN